MSDTGENTQGNKINIRVALSWGVPWIAGMLFTLGYVPYPSGLDFWVQVLKWIFYFFAWPYVLGGKLGEPPPEGTVL